MPRFVSQAQISVKLRLRKRGFDFVHALQTMTSYRASEVKCEITEERFDLGHSRTTMPSQQTCVVREASTLTSEKALQDGYCAAADRGAAGRRQDSMQAT